MNPTKRSQTDSGVHPAARPFLFLDKANVRTAISFGVIGLAALLLLVDFLVHRHEYLALGETRGFYAAFGFIAFGFVVLTGWPLRALLGRGEDYYGEPDDDA